MFAAAAASEALMHARIWKFRPPHGQEDAFASAYSETGRWAELFRKAEGYLGSSLLRPIEEHGWWLTIDRWHSLAHFEAFGRDWRREYQELDAELEGIAGEEEFVGAFEEAA